MNTIKIGSKLLEHTVAVQAILSLAFFNPRLASQQLAGGLTKGSRTKRVVFFSDRRDLERGGKGRTTNKTEFLGLVSLFGTAYN